MGRTKILVASVAAGWLKECCRLRPAVPQGWFLPAAASMTLAAVLLAGCQSKPRIVVGSKNFAEQLLLGEIAAQQIERRLNVSV